MDSAFLSAVSALGGSVVGGLISGIATWTSQRLQTRAGQVAHEISLRQGLYIEFIVAASKAYGDSIVNDQPRIEELATLRAMITRMHIISSPRIAACAEEVLLKTTDSYFKPNKTIRELYELMKSGRLIDPLQDFSEAVREEALQRYPGGIRLLLSHRPFDGGRANRKTGARSLSGILLNSVWRRRAS
jgi:hypothetical protein